MFEEIVAETFPIQMEDVSYQRTQWILSNKYSNISISTCIIVKPQNNKDVESSQRAKTDYDKGKEINLTLGFSIATMEVRS